MIFAKTGQPGAGKTLNAIKFAVEDSQFKDRQVYYYNIKGIAIDSWIELTEDQVFKWFDLPDGCVILIDECQDIWRPRPVGAPVPEHVEKLEKHRHRGMDFILTFQFPKQIDTVVRHLITDHYHYTRTRGLQATTVYIWDKLCQDTDSKGQRKLALTKTIPFDKKIFELYKSASLHTAKVRIPKFFYLIPLMVVSAIALAVYSYNRIYSSVEASPISDLNPNQSIPIIGDAKVVALGDPKGDYLVARTPLIENDPASAPIFAELHNAVSMPRPNCIQTNVLRRGKKTCVCYSQQATRMAIDEKQCIYHVANGYQFDYTQPDYRRTESEGGDRSGNQAAGAPFDLVPEESRPVQLTRYPSVVKHPLASN